MACEHYRDHNNDDDDRQSAPQRRIEPQTSHGCQQRDRAEMISAGHVTFDNCHAQPYDAR